MTLPYSLITAIIPDHLTKRFSLDAGGELLTERAGDMTVGHVRHVVATDLRDLASQLDALNPNQAPAWGLSIRDDVPIVTKRERANRPGAIARCREDFRFTTGPGIMMLDHDTPPPGSMGMTADALLDAVFVACPALALAPMLVRRSASAGIARSDGVLLRGLTRWRIDLPVSDAADIPDAGGRLMTLLWAARQAWHEVSRGGALLKRGILGRLGVGA